MSENSAEDAPSIEELGKLVREKIEKVIDERIRRALSGEQEWDALRQYVDRRIAAASEGDEPRPPWG